MKKTLLSALFVAFCSIAFSQITITSTVTNVTCFGGSNGSATVTATGGTGAYTFTWIPTNTNAPIITGLAAGSYTVNVMDASMNTNSLVVTIGQPSQLNSNAYAAPACNGLCNSWGSINAFGGTPPYMYIWSTGSNMPQVTNLCPGTVTVQVTDVNNCIAQQTINVIPTTLSINTTYTNTSCGGNCDGAAVVNVIGGTAPYTYYWPISGGSTTAYQNNLCAGTHSVQVTDANGCTAYDAVTILSTGNSIIPNATVTTISFNETCHLTGDGAIDLTISGSNPGPFTYTWSNGANTQDINNLNSGSYIVTVYDASMNCLTLIDTISAIGVNCGSIQGHVFIDNNSDCIQNGGDNNFTNASIIVNPGNRYGYANFNGDYIINNLPYGTYSVSLNLGTNGNIFPSCNTTITANVNSGNPNSTNNILTAGFNSGTQPDLKVSAWNQGVVPGFVCRMHYSLSNLNNVNGTGLFKVTLPSTFIPNIVNATSGYSVSGDTVIWAFSNIVYSIGTPYYFVDFITPLGTPLGSIFTSCMWAQPNITDFDFTNNTFCYSRTVTGSFDPNDKTVSPVGIGPNGDIAATETDLTYLIRFQNTGNGPAVNIVVKDTLSPNVDVNTFEMLGSSHNYNIDILPGNVLRWKFNNIMLADSGSNEPASHGYIQYRIKRTNNNTPGTQIKNTAYIYFDFNEPVVTNTAINTIETITGIKSSTSTNDEWNVYPNPSTGILYIINSSLVKDQSQIQVINSIGQTVLEETITSNYKNIDLSKLNNGVYFVKITSDKQSVIKRVVLSK